MFSKWTNASVKLKPSFFSLFCGGLPADTMGRCGWCVSWRQAPAGRGSSWSCGGAWVAAWAWRGRAWRGRWRSCRPCSTATSWPSRMCSRARLRWCSSWSCECAEADWGGECFIFKLTDVPSSSYSPGPGNYLPVTPYINNHRCSWKKIN